MDFDHQFCNNRNFLVTKLWWLKTFGCQAYSDQKLLIAFFSICHIVALPFTLKIILRKNKNYANSNISPCNNIIFLKNPLKETNFLQHITTLSLVPSFNTSQNIILVLALRNVASNEFLLILFHYLMSINYMRAFIRTNYQW
jgi:hypothetical protein